MSTPIAWIVSVISMGPSATDVDLRVWLIVIFGVWTIFPISTIQQKKTCNLSRGESLIKIRSSALNSLHTPQFAQLTGSEDGREENMGFRWPTAPCRRIWTLSEITRLAGLPSCVHSLRISRFQSAFYGKCSWPLVQKSAGCGFSKLDFKRMENE